MDKEVPGIVDDVADDVRAAVASLSNEPDEPTLPLEGVEPSQQREPETKEPVETKEETPPKPTAEKSGGPVRDPATGKFTKADNNGEPPAKSPAEAPHATDGEKGGSERVPTEGKADAAPPAAPTDNRPPPGWSVAAKSEWDKLPDHVRAAVAKREEEVNNGFATLKEFKDLKPYADMAQRSGTTLSEALGKYTSAETALRRDPQQGFVAIAQNLGLSQADAARTFMALAQRLGAQPSAPAAQNGNGAHDAGTHQNGAAHPDLRQALDPVLSPLLQEINTLKSTLSQQQQADQNRHATAAAAIVDEFAKDPKHRYYPDLEPAISDLLEKGIVQRTGDLRRDLETAYELASWQNPEVRAALIKGQHDKADADRRAREKEAADKAAKASRSVSGSPAPGNVDTAPRKPGEDDLEADVRAAMRASRA